MINKNLTAAKRAKNDEFYTRIDDISNECKYYKEYFKDKVILCNCDDPYESNFFKYFALNFREFKLKGLIATCYGESYVDNRQLNLFPEENRTTRSALSIVLLAEHLDKYDCIDEKVIKEVLKKKHLIKKLRGNGDFASEECLEFLKQADIVVTNPPFSKFRDFITILMKYNKKFLIIGNLNAITYKEFFPLLKKNLVWLGCSIHSGDRAFNVPDDYPLSAAGCGVDENGRKFIRVKGVRWFTNIDHYERHEKLILQKNYTPEEYPKYDNYDAINVDKVAEIPCDYDGVMGVPITFLDKYNPEQFEILGITQRNDDPYKIKRYATDEYKNANDLNARAVIIQKGGIPKTTYARLLIKRK